LIYALLVSILLHYAAFKVRNAPKGVAGPEP